MNTRIATSWWQESLGSANAQTHKLTEINQFARKPITASFANSASSTPRTVTSKDSLASIDYQEFCPCDTNNK
jgi:hypothetical protein